MEHTRKIALVPPQLLNSPELEWYDKGQLLINGKVIDNSNITDLVHRNKCICEC
jgi:hypothetical protein